MDALEKSFDAASEASKLLITLCTAVVAFGIAVINVKSGDATVFTPLKTADKVMLASSWFVLVSSIACGVWTQFAIAHVLSKATDSAPASIWSKRIRVPFWWQIAFFLGGLLLMVSYSLVRMFG